MAGHSKWHNIKHRKAAVDAKRGKMWSKCAKAIMVAAKNGGPDPSANITLRYAIDEARYANMPRDTIERAIKKGSGELGAQNFETVRYEGYGPKGVAIIVDGLTDNRTRTAADLRLILGNYGGNLGASGCVSFLFTSKGLIYIPAEAAGEEALMDIAIAAGAEDVTPPDAQAGADAVWTIATSPTAFHAVKQSIEQAGLPVAEARIDMLPSTMVTLTAQDARTLIELIDALEDNDDVQKVYTNFEVPDSELAALDD